MSKKILFAVAAGFTLGLLASSCGGGPKNLCLDKPSCDVDSNLVCDPTDGVCKCGGRGGLICPDKFVCDPVGNTCAPTRCVGVDCNDKPGTSCDVLDGVCRCGGTGGKICGANEVCNPNAAVCVPAINCNEIACPRNQTCDNSSGRCKCGAVECAAAQFCSVAGSGGAKTCVNDLCSGVKCAGTTVCDKADGYCKCNGAFCQSGEACSCTTPDGGTCADADRVCRPGSACTGVTCSGGTTCDPVDGQCKCGGPGGPICSSVQICFLGPPSQCQGGAQCTNPDGGAKVCVGGTSCDPEDGKCKCGGRGGELCKAMTASDPADICVSNPQQKSCKRPCDVRSPDCTTATYCYFDPTAATPAAYCSAAGDMQAEGTGCLTATACFGSNPAKSLHCTGLALGQAGICHAYCDLAAGTMAGCIQTPKAQLCTQIVGAPAGYGYCQPQ